MDSGKRRSQTVGHHVHESLHASVRISVNVTAHFANNVTGGFTRLRGV